MCLNKLQSAELCGSTTGILRSDRGLALRMAFHVS